MSDFHDPELRQQLGRLSGPYPDDNAAFEAWKRRVGQARRRRAMAWTTGSAMALLIAVVAVAALQSPGQNTLKAGHESSTSAEVTTTTAAPTTAPVTSMARSIVPDTTPTTSTVVEDTAPTTQPVVDTTPAPTDPAEGSGGAPTATTHRGSGSGGTTTPPPPPTTATTQPEPASQTQTFESSGGSIKVRLKYGRLTVVDISANPGFYGFQTDHYKTKVSVVFSSYGHQSEITVTIDHGVMVPEIHDGGDGHDGTYPGDSWPGGGGFGDGSDGDHNG